MVKKGDKSKENKKSKKNKENKKNKIDPNHHHPTKDPHHPIFREKLTSGQRAADFISKFGGSWIFISFFLF